MLANPCIIPHKQWLYNATPAYPVQVACLQAALERLSVAARGKLNLQPLLYQNGQQYFGLGQMQSYVFRLTNTLQIILGSIRQGCNFPPAPDAVGLCAKEIQGQLSHQCKMI